jgi:virginiamycin B lyase
MSVLTRPAVVRLSVVLALLMAWGAQFYIPQVVAAAPAAPPPIIEYPLPGNSSGPEGITAGPDGNMWVAQEFSNQIARVRPNDGFATQFAVPTTPFTDTAPLDITAGPDNNLWFAIYAPNSQIGKIDLNGNITRYDLPIAPHTRLWGVATGPDNNIWFTEYTNSKVGVVNTSGQLLHEYQLTAAAFPAVITRGPDNAMWFTEEGGNQIGRIDVTTGTLLEIPLTSPGPHGPCGITTGPDGNIWFAEQDGDKIGRITIPGHVLTEYPLPAGSGPVEMVGGPDGNVWVALAGSTFQNDQVAKVAMDGTITQYHVPTPQSAPYGMGLSPDKKNVWFTEDNTGTVGVIVLSPLPFRTYLPLIMR